MTSMIVTETARAGANHTSGDLAEFEFDAVAHSMTQDTLDLELKVNTSRETPPGAEEPVEQILSTEWGEVNFHGEWKDQWAGQGFADRTYQEFARMVLRTPIVRIVLGPHLLFGVITNFKIRWRTSFEIGWAFVLSVHKNASIGVARETPISPANLIDMGRRVEAHAEIVDRLFTNYQNMSDLQFTTEDIDDAGDDLEELSNSIDDARFAVNAATFDNSTSLDFDTMVDQTQHNLLSVATTFSNIRARAQESLLNVQELISSDTLAFEDVVQTLKFEEWSRSQYVECTRLIGAASSGEIDARARASRRVKGIHRVKSGDTLDRVSLKWYGNPNSGQLIRDANNLDSILLPVGAELIIPESNV